MTTTPDLDAIEAAITNELNNSNRLSPHHAYELLGIARVQQHRVAELERRLTGIPILEEELTAHVDRSRLQGYVEKPRGGGDAAA